MRSLTVAMVVLCLAGVVVSVLALREHYNTETSPCSINERWDCGAVNHSMFAAIGGVPVAALGILGYCLLGIVAGRFRRLTVLGAVAGLGFALRLSYIEWKVLEVWCIYCVASQGIILVIALLAVTDLFAARRAQSHP